MNPLHDEERKLIERLRKANPDTEIAAMHPHQLDGTAVDNAGVIILTMDAGNIQQAIDMARSANEAVARNPTIKFIFGINGCKDDPRETDEIPEACISLQALFNFLKREAFHRFDIEHQALMLVASGVGHRDGTKLHVPPELVRKP